MSDCATKPELCRWICCSGRESNVSSLSPRCDKIKPISGYLFKIKFPRREHFNSTARLPVGDVNGLSRRVTYHPPPKSVLSLSYPAAMDQFGFGRHCCHSNTGSSEK